MESAGLTAPLDSSPSRAAGAFAWGTATLAILVLLSWASGHPEIATFGRGYVPMAPSSAGLALLLSLGLLLRRLSPSRRPANRLADASAFFAGAFSLLVLVEFVLGIDLGIEHWFTAGVTVNGDFPIGRMSPVTSTVILMSSASLFFYRESLAQHRRRRQTASALALASSLICLFVILSYVTFAPLLYGGNVIPMSLIAAIAFMFLDCGLLASAGTEVWPLSFFKLRNIGDAQDRPMASVGGPIAVFLFLAVAIGVAGSMYFRHRIAESRAGAGKELTAVVDSKAEAIAVWYGQCRADGEMVLHTPMALAHFLEFFASPGDSQKAQDARLLLKNLRDHSAYRVVALYDARGELRASAPSLSADSINAHHEDLQSALHASEIFVNDLSVDCEGRNPKVEPPHFDIWIPIRSTDQAGELNSGALLLRVDPKRFLYPCLRSWPTSSQTAEVLLLRRDGDDIVYLNELRPRSDAADTHRFPIEGNSAMPAAKAAQGEVGVVTGRNGRGVPVLAAMRGVQGTPWFMVAMVDQAEIDAPLHAQARLLAFTIFTLILGTALSVILMWRRHDIQWLEQQLVARQALAQGQRLLREVLENMSDGLLVVDKDGQVLVHNPAVRRLFGEETVRLPLSEWSKHLDVYRSDESGPVPREALALFRALRGESTDMVERFLRSPAIPEGRWILTSGRPLEDDNGNVTGAVVVFQDITERRKLERQLAHSHKMEALGTLAGGIAHDFNNILYAILGFTDLAMDLTEKSSRAYECLEQIHIGGKRGKDLVGRVLTFSRRHMQEKVPMEVQAVIGEAVALLRGALPSTIELRLEIDPHCRPILGDPTGVHQVILNLCTNASHAMREHGGVLVIRLEETSVDSGAPTDPRAPMPGRYVHLTVKDFGSGMDEAVLSRIFDPYFTTKATGEGSGMGLAIVHGIVKGLGGTITVESAIGRGSRFDVYFPVLDDGWVVPKTHAPMTESREFGERVLLVDDESEIVELERRSLEKLGYTVAGFTSSTEALLRFEEDPDAFDVVITDQTMPGLTGVALARRMLRLRPDLPILLCTGYSETVSEEQARNMGIRGYLMKPIARGELEKALRAALTKVPAARA